MKDYDNVTLNYVVVYLKPLRVKRALYQIRKRDIKVV